MSQDFLSRIQIVLCRPEGGGNVGSICRVMKNMGLSRLAIVNPSSRLDKKQLSTMAVHAKDIYNNAEINDDLNHILRDSVLTAGITRRRGNRRKFFSYLPEEFAIKASEIVEGTISIVFGNEQHGLNEEELACCTAAVHIPSSPEHPSLNLSHAVQVIAYTLFRQAEHRVNRFSPIKESDLMDLTKTVYSSLEHAGAIKLPDSFDNRKFFHDILGRATLSSREAKHLEKLFQALKYNKE